MRNEMNNQEKTLEEKLRELSMDDLNKITYQKIVVSASIKDTMQRPDVKAKWDETKAKISAGNKGKVMSDEAKAKISASLIGHQRNVGFKHTDESRAKMSDAQKGRVVSDETKAKMSDAQKGKVISDEHKAKISLPSRVK
jgi:hypothetical protein